MTDDGPRGGRTAGARDEGVRRDTRPAGREVRPAGRAERPREAASFRTVFWGFLLRFFVAYAGLLGLLLCVDSSLSLGADRLFIAARAFWALLFFSAAFQSFFGGALLFGAAGVCLWWQSDRIVSVLYTLRRACAYLYAGYLDRLSGQGFVIPEPLRVTVDASESTHAAAYAAVFLFAAAVLLGAVFAFLAVRRTSPFLLAGVSALVLFPCLFYYFMPDTGAFLLLVCSLLTLHILRVNRPPDEADADGRTLARWKARMVRRFSTGSMGLAAFLLCLGCAALAMAADAPTPELARRLPEAAIQDVREYADALVSARLGQTDGGYAGGMGGGLLGQPNRGFTGHRVMTVTAPADRPVYLRGWIAGDYDGTRWQPMSDRQTEAWAGTFGGDFESGTFLTGFLDLLLSDREFADSVNLSAGETGIVKTAVGIRFDAAGGKLLYTPSVYLGGLTGLDGETPAGADGMLTLDTGLFSVRRREYGADAAIPDYADPAFFNILRKGYYVFDQIADELEATGECSFLPLDEEQKQAIRRERQYEEYAKTYDTALPDTLPERVRQFAQKIAGDESVSPINRILAVQDYLSRNYTYTLQPDAYDPEKNPDYVDYFLFEEKKGYCTAYATAMVVLLRAVGIPARYVEGYLSSPDGTDGGETTETAVYDDDAHAWPEAYVPGVGWLPFEPTSPYTLALNAGTAVPDADDETAPESKEGKPADSGATTAPESGAEEPPENSAAAGKLEPEDGGRRTSGFLLAAAALPLLLFGVLYGRRRLCAGRRRRAFSDSDPNAAVLAMQEHMLRLLSAKGLAPAAGELPTGFAKRVDAAFPDRLPEPYGRIMEIVLRAKFGPGSLSEAERARTLSCTEGLSETVLRGGGWFWRFRLRYLLGLA